MATKLKKSVVRETGFSVQGNPVIITLEEGGKMVDLRQKGRRFSYRTSIEQIWWLAVRSKVAWEREIDGKK